LSIKQTSLESEFGVLLRKIAASAEGTGGINPIDAAIKEIAGGSDVLAQKKFHDRIGRRLRHLLDIGAVEMRVNPFALKNANGDFYRRYIGEISPGFEKGQRILKFLNSKLERIHPYGQAQIRFMVHPDTQTMYNRLKAEILKSAGSDRHSGILLTHGKTISELKDAILGDREGLARLRSQLAKRRGESDKARLPIFIPASGNYYTKDAVPKEIFEYFTLYSANNTAMYLNSALGLDSYLMGVPAIMEHAVADDQIPAAESFKEFADLIMKDERHPLLVLKQAFKANSVYRKTYPNEQGERGRRISPEIGTIIFTFGSSHVMDPRLSYTKYLRKFDPILGKSVEKANQEVLLRFSRDGAPIDRVIAADAGMSAEERIRAIKRIHTFYFSYLGLKESACAELTHEWSMGRRPTGMGSNIIVDSADKLPAVLLSVYREEPIANRVHILFKHIPVLAQALDSVPELAKAFESVG
jgi:hypothetical protein